jgi:hypothetical protein
MTDFSYEEFKPKPLACALEQLNVGDYFFFSNLDPQHLVSMEYPFIVIATNRSTGYVSIVNLRTGESSFFTKESRVRKINMVKLQYEM